MNTKTTTGFVVASLVLLVPFGCVTGRRDLARSGEVKVLTEGSKTTELLTPSVYQEEGKLVVSGQVRRSPMVQGAIAGHIHIEQLSSDGGVIRDSMESLGMTSRRGRTRVATYTARLPWTLEPGSTIPATDPWGLPAEITMRRPRRCPRSKDAKQCVSCNPVLQHGDRRPASG